MRKIILDTNFLMIPWQFRVDIFSELDRICNFEYKLYIYEQSISELRNIMQKASGNNKKAAGFALRLIRLKNINVIKAHDKDVDSLILENIDNETVVATQDRPLKKKLLQKNASVIILRQKKYLKIIEKLYK